MTSHLVKPSVSDGAGLLERAISYALGSLHLVTADSLADPTPCRDWHLADLLRHVNDSFAALHEALDFGQLRPSPDDPLGDAELVRAARDRACLLMGASTSSRDRGPVSIADRAVSSSVVTTTGAIEIAVHGWDIARACRYERPIPAELATEMLVLTPIFVSAVDRPARFAVPVPVPATATPSERLVAFLGRPPTLHSREAR